MIDSQYLTVLQKKPSYPNFKNYHWADYIELVCLANLDGELSKADIIDRLSEREYDLDEGQIEDLKEIDLLDEEDLGLPTQRSRRTEVWSSRLDSWFEIVQSRQSRYKSNYPFTLNKNDLTLNYDPTNKNHKYYFFLLLCSKLYLLDKKTSNTLSAYYELMCHDGLSKFLPNSFNVELFGTNPLNDSSQFGKGITCLNKIKNLATSLNETIKSNINEDAYPPNHYGDAGLDLIAVSDTGDDQTSKITILGQCACTEDWVNKQSTSGFEKWSNIINLTTFTINAIFIPFCFREASGNWFNQGEIRKTFIVDRARLIYFLKEDHSFDSEINDILETIINAKESVI